MARAVAEAPGADANQGLGEMASPRDSREEPPLSSDVVLRIRKILWEKVGVIRNAEGLGSAFRELDAMEDGFRRAPNPPARPFLLVARLITRAALLRTESRGCHYRTDYPSPDPGAPKHSQIQVDSDGVTIQAYLAEAPAGLSATSRVPSPA
jgi:L-aspartate oxidase